MLGCRRLEVRLPGQVGTLCPATSWLARDLHAYIASCASINKVVLLPVVLLVTVHN